MVDIINNNKSTTTTEKKSNLLALLLTTNVNIVVFESYLGAESIEMILC